MAESRQPPIGYAWQFLTDAPGKWRDIEFTPPAQAGIRYIPVYEDAKPLPQDQISQLAMQYLTVGMAQLTMRDFEAFCRQIVFGIRIATGPIPPSDYKKWYDEAQTKANEYGFGPGTAAEAIEDFALNAYGYRQQTIELTEAISKAYHTENVVEMRAILHAAMGTGTNNVD